MRAIIKVEKLKSQGPAMGNRFDHNYRLEKETNAHVHPERTQLNEELVKLPEGCKDYTDFVKKREAEISEYQKKKIRKDAVKGFGIILSYTKDNIPKNFSVDKWKEAAKEFLYSKFGRENVGAAVLHLDENSPHIHAFVTPIVDNHFRADSYYDEYGRLETMREDYFRSIEHLGLERSPHYDGRKASAHQIDNVFYVEMSKAERDKLPEREPFEPMDDYTKRLQEFHSATLGANKLDLIKSKQDHEKIEALEESNFRLYNGNQDKSKQIESLKDEAERYKDAFLNMKKSFLHETEKARTDGIEEGKKAKEEELEKEFGTSLEDAKKIVARARHTDHLIGEAKHDPDCAALLRNYMEAKDEFENAENNLEEYIRENEHERD